MMHVSSYKTSNRRGGSPRYGTKSDDYDYTKVTEYKLSEEELRQYQNGEKGGSKLVKFEKKEYLALKDEGKTDGVIQKLWGIDHNKMQKLKKEWGLIGAFSRPPSKNKELTKEEKVNKETPVEAPNNESVIELNELKNQNENLEKENLRLMKILSGEAEKFVDLEEKLEKKDKLLSNLNDQIQELELKCNALTERNDLLFGRVKQLREDLQVQEKQLQQSRIEVESDYEVACHERDALITTLKVISRTAL